MTLRPILAASLLVTTATAAPPPRPPSCPVQPAGRTRAMIQTTCDEVRAALARVPGGSVRRSRESFLDERFDCTRDGCVVRLKGSFRKLGDQETPDVWLGDFLETRGWTRIGSHDADGPDGTTYSLHRPGALCIVEGRWSHWDDQDGGHTDDWYRITVSCGGAGAEPPHYLKP